MTCMLDRWHNAYHGDDPDYVNCPYCQEELATPDEPLPPEDQERLTDFVRGLARRIKEGY